MTVEVTPARARSCLCGCNPLSWKGISSAWRPLREEHAAPLFLIGNDPSIWRYMLYGAWDTEEKMRAWCATCCSRQAAGT